MDGGDGMNGGGGTNGGSGGGSEDGGVARFRRAVERSDAEALRRVLSSHPTARAAVNEPLFSFGGTALARAAAARSLPMIDVLLEFGADPESPMYNPALAKDKTVLLYCASGGRSALAGKVLQDMGYGAVFNIGGFKELADAGVPTEPV